MKNSKKINLNYQIKTSSNAKLSIIFLHGFTGSSNDWLHFFNQLPDKVNLIAIDLPGHRKNYSSGNPDVYTLQYIINEISAIIKILCIGKVILVGYSMGGRAALSYACKNPKEISGLILESTTAGLENSIQIQERIDADTKLAEFIENNSIEAFVDYWLNLSLFNSQQRLNIGIRNEIRRSKLFNNPIGLANSLRGFGTGIMPNLWNELNKIICPTLLISGGLDEKFTSVNHMMNKKIKDSEHIIIEDCGHNTHLERPEVFVSLVNDFINNL